MSVKSLPENMRWIGTNERFGRFYHLIASEGVKIHRFSDTISRNIVVFKVEGSDENCIKNFVIFSNSSNRKVIQIAVNFLELGRVKSSDKVWSSILSEARNVNPGTYNGTEFLDSVVPSLGKFLLSNIKKEEVGTTKNSQSVMESATIGSTTTKPSDFKQLEESTTERVDHEVQKDSEYVTMESAPLKEQEPELVDFASSKATTKEIKDVINEIKELNASDGITPKNTSSVSSFDHNSKKVLEHPMFNSTDVEDPKLPEINGGQYIRISAAVIAGGILGGVLAVAFVGSVYFIWHRKNREGSDDVEKAQKSNSEAESLSEQIQLERPRATPKTESLLSEVSNATSVVHLSSRISTGY